MKLRLGIKILILLVFTAQVFAQDLNLSVTGHVLDVSTGAPISNHSISLAITGNGFIETYNFFSNDQGFWGADSLVGYNQGTVHAMTYDCNGQVHEFQENYYPGFTTFIFDFYICQDSLPANDCENWFEYSTNDNYQFFFSGFSEPQAFLYNWDFGDGQTGSGQLISHVFDQALSGYIPVTLTTYAFNPVIMDSCTAVSQQFIWVGNSNMCQADFIYEVDSVDKFKYYFTDNSTGLVSGRQWDFGDSSFSMETNPVHVFPFPGIFNVCLAIYSDSLGIICTDTYCQSIVIDYSLTADFTATLDTLSGMTNLFSFSDNSSGEPTAWLWEFGDGNISSNQFPYHQYEESGTYEVCLEVSRNFIGWGTLTHNFCKPVVAPEYYDLGGMVYLDNFPMNNLNGDTTVTDTGMAFLYRKYANDLIAVDTTIFFQFGYYWFSQVREGNYIVKVGLTDQSLNYMNFIASYHEGSLFWNEATTVELTDSNNYFANINLIKLNDLQTGPGAISGNLTMSAGKQENEGSLSGFEIILMNQSAIPLTFGITDESGNFSFENVPLGTYLLYAEATGFYSVFETIILNEENPVVNQISLTIYDHMVGIENNADNGLNHVTVYPNPVLTILNIRLKTESASDAIIRIYDSWGRLKNERQVYLTAGNQTLQYDCQDLSSGIYFISIHSDKMKTWLFHKFIK